MAKYIIDLPENTHWIQWIMESTKDQHQVCRLDFKRVEDLTPYTEPDFRQVKEFYEQGLADAWEAARKIASDNAGLKYSIFGQQFTVEILNTHSASEAVEEIRAYEQAQKEKEEELGIQGYFKNGEEVIDADGTKAVILRVSEDNYCQVYTEKGCIENWHIHTYKFHKTGRTFPEIAAVLEKMREGQK